MNNYGSTINILCLQDQIEVVCQLPHEYPEVCPEVFLRTPTLSRSQHRSLSDALQIYIINDLEKGQLYMCSVIQWIQDNKESYFTTENESNSDSVKDVVHPKYDTFSRMWIYSHHIYNKFKRKAILEFSDELNLTGFCMPGKPGMICIEGDNDNVEEFWHRIRRMQWKRVVMKEKEDTKLGLGQTIDKLRRFDGFEERSFEPRLGKGRDARADRGLLYQFLEQRGCAHIFPLYYGVAGHAGDDND